MNTTNPPARAKGKTRAMYALEHCRHCSLPSATLISGRHPPHKTPVVALSVYSIGSVSRQTLSLTLGACAARVTVVVLCVCVCVCVCQSVHSSNLLVAQLRDKLVILTGSVSWSLQNKFGVFRIMASFRSDPILRAHGSRPFLDAKRAHFPHSFRPRDFTRAVNFYARMCLHTRGGLLLTLGAHAQRGLR